MINDKPELEADLELIEAFRCFDTGDTGIIGGPLLNFTLLDSSVTISCLFSSQLSINLAPSFHHPVMVATISKIKMIY